MTGPMDPDRSEWPRYQGMGSWPSTRTGTNGVLPRRPGLWHAKDEVREGPRHTPDWYEQEGRERPCAWVGQRMLIRCNGGPCFSRLDTFPPLLELDVPGGHYTLVDDGPAHEWWYRFAPNSS